MGHVSSPTLDLWASQAQGKEMAAAGGSLFFSVPPTQYTRLDSISRYHFCIVSSGFVVFLLPYLYHIFLAPLIPFLSPSTTPYLCLFCAF